MTLCIAAMCDQNRAIVAVADTKLTLQSEDQSFEADSVLIKRGYIAPTWRVMFAGALSGVSPILRRIRAVSDEWGTFLPAPIEQVEETCKTAYRSFWDQDLEDRILARFGLTLADYRDHGAPGLDVAAQAVVADAVLRYALGLDLLVYGFDAWPHVLMVDSPGVVTNYDAIGYWAVGGGDDTHSSVIQHIADKRATAANVAEALVHLCVAKWQVEGKDGIGQATVVDVLYKDDEIRAAPEPLIKLKALWQATHLLHGQEDWKQAVAFASEAIRTGLPYSEQQRIFHRDYETRPEV